MIGKDLGTLFCVMKEGITLGEIKEVSIRCANCGKETSLVRKKWKSDLFTTNRTSLSKIMGWIA